MKSNWLLGIAVMTVLCALAWVFSDAYHAYTTATISPALEEIAIPITPTLDRNVITKLKQRRQPVTFYAPVSATPVVKTELNTIPLGTVATNSANVGR